MLVGESEIVKSTCAAEFTVSVTVVECDKVPLVPVMVTVAVPVAAVALAVKVRTLVEVVGFVPKVVVTPEGKPDADRLTLPVKPPEGVTEIVVFPLLPWTTVTLEGEAESEKLGLVTGFTVREIVVV
jgi:hypothetical protein